jgi:hypothetical protein
MIQGKNYFLEMKVAVEGFLIFLNLFSLPAIALPLPAESSENYV